MWVGIVEDDTSNNSTKLSSLDSILVNNIHSFSNLYSSAFPDIPYDSTSLSTHFSYARPHQLKKFFIIYFQCSPSSTFIGICAICALPSLLMLASWYSCTFNTNLHTSTHLTVQQFTKYQIFMFTILILNIFINHGSPSYCIPLRHFIKHFSHACYRQEHQRGCPPW